MLFTGYLFAACAASAQIINNKNTLPDIGVVGADTLSIEEELTIGKAIFAQLRGQGGVLYDPVVQEYIQSLGNKLVIQADNTKYPFTFFVINNPTINAMAFFGGHVGTHTGLIYTAQNEAELASVLAHEIAHVTQRHIVRRMQAAERNSPLQIASMIGGAILLMASPEAGIAAITAGNAGAIQSNINYTRSYEKEADRIGIRILADSGFDPFAASAFFGRMLESKRWSSQAPAFLQTHPLSQDRVAEARNRAENLPKLSNPDSPMFAYVKARIQARYMYTASHNITYYLEQLNRSTAIDDTHLQYGLAIAYMRNKQADKALPILKELLSDDRENLAFIDALADVYIELDQYSNALSMLAPLASTQAHNEIITLNYANVLIKAGQTTDAIELLKDYLMVVPESVLGHQLISDAYAASKQPMLMHQANAELYQLLSVYGKAIDELQFAYNYAENYLTKQRIRARINQLRETQLALSER